MATEAPPPKKARRKFTKEEIAEQRARAAAKRATLTDFQDGNQVMTLEQTAARHGVSKPTLVRIIRAGNGPRVTRLSERRIGIRVCDYREWAEARLREAA